MTKAFCYKFFLGTVLFLQCATGLRAQTDATTLHATPLEDSLSVSQASTPIDTHDGHHLLNIPAEPSLGSLPLEVGAYGLGGLQPFSCNPYDYSWRLHEGFNAQMGMSLSVGMGKHAPKGVGFGQNAAFAYVLPVTPKLTLAAGVFASNMDWGTWRRTNVGIGAMAAYTVNDRINLYAYASKSFLPRGNDFRFRRDPFPLFLEQQKDRIGAAAEFKIGQNAMIGISVEYSSY